MNVVPNRTDEVKVSDGGPKHQHLTDTRDSNGGHARLQWLDAMRGLAVIGVVAVHAAGSAHLLTGPLAVLAASGQYGVQLFFIVSAPTISLTYSVQLERNPSGPKTALSWLVKRFFRLAPLYYFAIVFYAVLNFAMFVLSHHKYGSLPPTPVQVISNVLFIHAWVPQANNNVVPGGWSIGVEVFFYLLIPLIWPLLKTTWGKAVVLAFIPVSIGLSLFANHMVEGTWYVKNNEYFFYWFPTQYGVFAIGLVLWQKLIGIQVTEEKSSSAAGWGVLFLATLAAGIYCGTWKQALPVLSPVLVAISFVSLILAFPALPRSLIVNKTIVAMGQRSYSVYILHFAVLDAFRFVLQPLQHRVSANIIFIVLLPLTAAIAYQIAGISKRLLEDPGVNYGHKLSKRLLAR